MFRPRDIRERLGDEQLAAPAVDRVREAVLVEMHQDFAQSPADHQVDQNHLGVRVVVPAVVRRELIRPHQRSVARPPREHAVGPFVLARPLLGVVRTGIAGPEVDEVELGIVGDPAPNRCATAAPGIALPRRDADVRVRGVVPASRPCQHQRVWAHVVGGPENLAGPEVESLDPAVDAELAAGRPHDHAVAGDKRRHRRRLALVHVGDLRLPHFTARDGIDGYRVPVEQIVDDLAVRVHRAAVDGITTR